jgi:hypothetical protein
VSSLDADIAAEAYLPVKKISTPRDHLEMSKKVDYDVEAKAANPTFAHETDSAEYIGDEGAIRGEALIIGDTFYARMQRFAHRFGVEARGIERVPSDERSNAGMSQIGTMVCASGIGRLAN